MSVDLEMWLEYHGEHLDEIVLRRFGTTTFEIIAVSPVLWTRWNHDHDVAYIALPDGRRELVTLDSRLDLDRDGLLDRVAAYREAIEATETILRLLDVAGS